MRVSSNRLKFIGDTLLNLVAFGLPLAILQLFILPALARTIDAEINGLILSLIALFSILPSTLGNALNNTRLLENDAAESGVDDDSYRLILLCSALADAVAVIALTWLYSKHFGWNVVLMTISATLLLVQEYLKASYRINLNYRPIVVSAFLLSAGYVIGYLVFLLIGEWCAIYLVGQLLSTSYVVMTTDLWRGPCSAGLELRRICLDYGTLLGSNLLGRAVEYADRLLLYPLMGGYSVSVYYTSTILAKLLSTVVTPMNSVVLSYLSRMKKRPMQLFQQAFIACIVVCASAYVMTLFVSRPVLTLMYPQYVDDAMPLIWITTAASYITIISSVLNPFVLKFTSVQYQIVVNALYLVVYVSSALLFLRAFGLIGFCVGSLVAAIVKLLAQLVIYSQGKARDA